MRRQYNIDCQQICDLCRDWNLGNCNKCELGVKNVNIKDWLNRGRKAEGIINDLELTKECIRCTLFKNQSKDYKILFEKYLELESEINSEIDKLFEIKKEIYDLIKQMPYSQHRRILQLRYLCMLSWEQIANITHYEKSWVQRGIHSQALQLAQKIRDGD